MFFFKGRSMKKQKNASDIAKKPKDTVSDNTLLQEYRLIVENLDEMIALVNKAGCCTFANTAFLNHYGLQVDRVPGMPMSEILGGDFYNATVGPMIEKAFTGEALRRKVDVDYGEQGKQCFFVKCLPIKYEDGSVERALLMMRDMTAHAKMDDEIRKMQKLETVGALAGGIAHDFNNMLGTILGYTNLAQLHAGENEELAEHLGHIQDSVARATRLTHQLLTFSKGGMPVKNLIHLQPLIRESAEFAMSGSNISASYIFDDMLTPVEADKELIAQVIQNVVVNAAQAMPSGGTIKIRASNITLEERNRSALEPGNYVKIEISDTGVGIHPKNLKNIFDPFFTTKECSQGLGLATVHSIVRSHNGNVTVDSAPGAGSSFAIYLPAAKHRVGAIGKPVSTGQKGKILVMDDDEDTRGYVRKVIKQMGYEALLAGNGEEAVEAYQKAVSAGESVKVAVLDLTVRGGMGGVEALQKLLELNPSLKAVLVSGYVNDQVMEKYTEYGFKAVLPKPYEISQLEDIIRRLLGED